MAKQQVLQTIINLGGNVDNSFGQLGTALIDLGNQIDTISYRLINFGKESIGTYAEYDDLMRETQAVGGYTIREMEKLDKLNREIAQTSTYTNLESADAMVLIAQAGKDVEDTYALLPSVLDLAMAGNLELADSVDYLLSTLSALGEEMDYAGILTDQMAKTAALGMTDIDTLGESMMRLGSASGEFFASSEEILTILSVMSKFGHDQRGAQGGTWLRNFMLSLAAPTGNIDDIVDAMEQLGIVEAEIEEFASRKSNGIAAEAVNSLIDQGLRIYDDQGKLLPAIDIIKSLRDTVRGNAAYADDLLELTGAINAAGGDLDAFVENADGLSDNALYSVFSKIFGKRGITTAMNLISISDEEWDRVFNDVLNSEGFADSMAETMQGGIGGAMRELNAAWTELKTTAGEGFAPAVEGITDMLHTATVWASNWDESVWTGLTNGLGAIAVAGPGLKIAGTALKWIGTLSTPVGRASLAVAGLAGTVALLHAHSEQLAKEAFGDMELDSGRLNTYVQSLGDDFEAAYTEVDKFNAALEQSIEDYTTASQTFSGELMTAMLTDTTLTDADIANLQSLGRQMHQSLIGGIANSTASTMSYWEMLFGGEGTAEYDPAYQEIIALTNQSYLDALSTAEAMSQGLRDAMTKAFDDRNVTDAEYTELKEWMQSYNEAMAQAAAEAKSEEDYVNFQMMLHKAQTASYESIVGMDKALQEERDAALAKAEEEYLTEYFKLKYRGASDDVLNAVRGEHEQELAAIRSTFDDRLSALWHSSAPVQEFYSSIASAMDSGNAMDIRNIHGNPMAVQARDAMVENLAAMYDFEKVLADETSRLAEQGSIYRDFVAAYSLMYGKASNNLDAYRLEAPQFGLAESAQTELAEAQAILDEGVTAPGAVDGLYEDAILEIGYAQSYLDSHPGTWKVNAAYSSGPIHALKGYADGGRATQASIFGEAGPEWAIPEEHTANTASLIWQAAQASGFTWGDIAAANSGASGRNTGGHTLIYSPTVIAADASGVEQKLIEDKERLDRWLQERELKEKISVYDGGVRV